MLQWTYWLLYILATVLFMHTTVDTAEQATASTRAACTAALTASMGCRDTLARVRCCYQPLATTATHFNNGDGRKAGLATAGTAAIAAMSYMRHSYTIQPRRR
jgi:hypothetical protein